MNATDCIRHALASLVLVCAALALAACSTLPAPRDYLPEADAVGQDVRGSWANVRCRENGKKVTHSGELIAVDADSLYLSTGAGALQSFSTGVIDRVQVAMFNPHEETCYGLGVLGGISTLSTGYYMVLGLPVWLIVGSATGADRVDDAVTGYPHETTTFAQLHPYARFPQGLPAHTRHVVPGALLPAPRNSVEPVTVSKYALPESSGSGVVGGIGGFENGGASWSAGFHQRVHRDLFAMGGFTQFDRSGMDMDQWWLGMRVGDPVFLGVKYDYSTQLDKSASGVSYMAGFMTAAAQRVSIGAILGYDDTGFAKPRTEDQWWIQFQLQLTVVRGSTP